MKNSVQCLCVLLCGSFLSACVHVPAYQQERLSERGMVFEDSLVSATAGSVSAQLEPGAASSGGAQSSGCSACK